ncbi:MAG: AAA family ATPase [Candidatus Aenigmatarchaeota archaeon]|nr:AAA family ATPase [Candidatus Aenigmarchaeota archaeon]
MQFFKNQEALSPEYLPEILPHREAQIKYIADILSRTTKGLSQNIFIFGSPGIGKTASIKFIFRQFQEYSNIDTIYINTWDYNTPLAILTKIVISLNYPIPRRGLSKDEVLEKLIEVLKKLKKGLVICLDEVDQLFSKDQSVLYDLLRINQYVDMPVCIVMISNYKDILLKLEPRIQSSLNVEEVEFKPYTLEEMKDILNERCKEAFVEKPEEGVVLICANHAITRGGDVRIGLECLRKASIIAEHDGKLKVEHVRKVLNQIKSVKMDLMKSNLQGVEKNLVDILSNYKTFTSTELWKEYCDRFGGISQNALTEHIKRLQQIGLISIKESRKESRGRKVFIRLMKRKKFK